MPSEDKSIQKLDLTTIQRELLNNPDSTQAKKAEQLKNKTNELIQNELKKGSTQSSNTQKPKGNEKTYSSNRKYELKKELKERLQLDSIQNSAKEGNEKILDKKLELLEKKYDSKKKEFPKNAVKIKIIEQEIKEREQYENLLNDRWQLERAIKTGKYGEKEVLIRASDSLFSNHRSADEGITIQKDHTETQPRTREDVENALKELSKKIEPFEKKYGKEPSNEKSTAKFGVDA